MANIDDKVVAMSFESSKFESGVSKTLSALEKLKAALKFPGAGKGLDDVSASAKKINLGHVASALDDIKNRLSAFRLMAIAVFAQVAQRAIAAGASFVKAFTLDPVKAGFTEYTTNLNAVQTILANTQASGAKLKDVNAALLDLNKYSDKTIYNFAQMARNIGTFTAAGVDLKTSTAAIKGIANLAALSGSSAEQAATAMYQLSQAISAGRVGLQDWNSVVNAGMGGAVFQRALAQTAVAMGELKEGSLKLVGPMKNVSINGESFRQSMMAAPGKTSWLTSDVLTNTLKQFTNDMSAAELKAQGFNDAQIKAIQATSKTAMEAATKVKTLTQVLDVAKEAAGSGWAQTWQIIFGDFGEARTLFTGVSNAVNGFINVSADARNKVLGDWKALGGRTQLIEGIKTVFEALGAIMKPIKEAFRDIFPAKTGQDLYDLTLRFKAFAETLKPSPETVKNLHRTFEGLFALLDIGKQVISGIFTVFGKLFGAIGAGSGGFLGFTANVGDFLVKVDQALKKGNLLHNFFAGLGTVLSAPLKILREVAQAIADLFSGFSPGDFSIKMGSITKVTETFGDVIEGMAKGIETLGTAVGNALGNINWETVLAVVRTGLLAGFVLMIKKFIGGTNLSQLFGVFGKSVGKSFGAGILGNVSSAFGSLTGTLKSMQQELKARTLQEIAVAIALLAAAVLALSLVDPEKLSGSLGAMTILFGELIGAMAILDKITSSKSFIKLPVIAASLILLAGAIDLLVISVIAMSRLSWNELIKGLGGVAALLGGLSAAAGPLSRNSAGLIRAGVGITAIAVALKILASAVEDFGGMSWTELGKGMASIGVGLGLIAAGAKLMPKGMVLKGAGLAAMAAGLRILADAVAEFGGMDWRELGNGLICVGGGLVVIAGAMQIMPGNMVVTAAGLLLVAASLGKIVDAVGKMGGMDIRDLAKGLAGLAGSLVILAASLHAMSGTMGGALALGAAATGLALLAPALIALGRQSWTELLKSLIGLGAALGVIAAAALLLAPSVPALLGFGAALVVIGAGLALAGAGVALIGVGLSAIATSGVVAIRILIQGLSDLVEAIPRMAKNFILGILEIVQQLADTAPQFVKALAVIIDNLLDLVIKSAPKMAKAFVVLVVAALDALAASAPKIIQAGFDLLMQLLKGINDNIGQVTTMVVKIITTFLTTVAGKLGSIITAGFDVLKSFISGVINNIGQFITMVVTLITTFVTEIANNMNRIITAGTDIVINFVKGIANNIGRVINVATDIMVNLLTEIANNIGKVISAGANLIVSFVTGIGNNIGKVVTAATNIMTHLLNEIADNVGKVITAGANILIKFLDGIANNIAKVTTSALNIITKFLSGIASKTSAIISAGADIIVDFVTGIGNAGSRIVTAGTNAMIKFINAISKNSVKLVDAGFHAIINFLNGVANSIEAHEGEMIAAGIKIGVAIVKGMINGLTSWAPSAINKATEIGHAVINGLGKAVSWLTGPSAAAMDIGGKVVQGLAIGLSQYTAAADAAAAMGNSVIGVLNSIFQTESPSKVTEEIGKFVGQGFAKGIRGTKDDINSSFADLNKMINEGIEEAKKNKDKATLLILEDAHNAVTKSLVDEKKQLIHLSGEYTNLSKRLDAAQQLLTNRIKERDDAITTFSKKYSTLPPIVTEDAEQNSVNQLAHYMEALKHEADAVAAYHETLKQLRQLGLDDATYQKLLDEGTMDQEFANQLLAGGRTAVESLNALDANLLRVSGELATNAAKNLHQAGVDAAQGLVDGLKKKHNALEAVMVEIAQKVVKTLKRELKIKSPSEEFASIGEALIDGLTEGFTTSANEFDNAVQDVIGTIKGSFKEISGLWDEWNPPAPVITPIVDLTQAQLGMNDMYRLLNPTPGAAYAGQIQYIPPASGPQEDRTHPATITFEQNNYSPESLSEVEIYRQTRNQLSQLKLRLLEV